LCPAPSYSGSTDIRDSNNVDIRATAIYSNNKDIRAPVEYDLVTPMQLYIRGHCLEVDISMNNRQSILNVLNTNVIQADIYDIKQLELRKIRNPVTKGQIIDRKIQIFEKINYYLFNSLGGIFKDGMALVLSMERINLFEAICDRLYDLNNDAINYLFKLEEKNDIEDINIIYDNKNDNNSELIFLGNKFNTNENNFDLENHGNNENISKSVKSNKIFSVLKDMKLRIFPERRIEEFDEVIICS
jgi:hypothetical protein